MEVETKINIEKYIEGTLQGEALSEFENLLQSDKAVQEEVRFQQNVLQTLQAKQEFEEEKPALVSFLNGLEQHVETNTASYPNKKETEEQRPIEPATEIVDQNSSTSSIFRKIIPFASLAAAAAIVLFVLGPWQNNLSSFELATNHFSPFNLESVRGAPNEISNIKIAQQYYDQKDYQLAIDGFNHYLKQNPKAPNVWLAKGSAEFELNLLNEAIRSFEKSRQLNPNYKAIALWYLALTHLKKEENEKATAALSQILKGEEKYEAAQKLIKQIEKIR